MNKLPKTLYWNLYTPYENQETEQELDDCHKQRIDVLDKRSANWFCRSLTAKTR